jgi:ribosomal protein L40E
MTKKSLGYVELEWICPSCGNRNPGPVKTCGTCGTPQPADVEFVQPAQETLVEDEEKVAAAKAGPDIHCGYCGARNPATAKSCHQCGADLSEGEVRSAGAVLGAYRSQAAPPVTCPACGSPNPATARFCRKCGSGLQAPKPEPVTAGEPAKPPSGFGRMILLAFLGFVALVVVFMVLANRTKDLVGTVADVSWQRTIVIEELGPVVKETWLDEIPEGAELGACRQRAHHTQPEPAPGAKEICGTPYTVDTGSGYGEVVQDCEYQVYADWCEYTVQEWRPMDSVIARGNDLNPQWPALTLSDQQREGERKQDFVVVFETDGKSYQYKVRNPDEFEQFQPGSRWILKVNTFDAITDVSPVR